MTIESREQFELCKQVYEATGWECDGEYIYHHNDLVDIVQGKPAGDYWENNWWFPLYTSDYILEKLPERVNRGVLVLTNGERPHAGYAQNDQYGYPSLSRGFYERAEYSDTPLKALLKLTLKLHEEEIL